MLHAQPENKSHQINEQQQHRNSKCSIGGAGNFISPPSSPWPLLRLPIKDSNLTLKGTVILYKNSPEHSLEVSGDYSQEPSTQPTYKKGEGRSPPPPLLFAETELFVSLRQSFLYQEHFCSSFHSSRKHVIASLVLTEVLYCASPTSVEARVCEIHKQTQAK